MEKEFWSPDIFKDLYFSKEMDWVYTMVEDTFEHYANKIFEQDLISNLFGRFWVL